LYDTFGTPRDLIRVSLEERGSVIDEDQFNESFDAALQQLQQTGTAKKLKGKPGEAGLRSGCQSSSIALSRLRTTRVDDGKFCPDSWRRRSPGAE
jgi:hypothetical protein